ncbi:MAG: hypothetical protein ACJ79S_01215, partial [Gemmatimonadaceae bacterium]
MTFPTDDPGRPAARGSANEPYHYRRRLGARDLWVAAGIGAAAGVTAFYVASLLLQRTPLETPRVAAGAAPGSRGTSGGRGRRGWRPARPRRSTEA